MDDERIAVVRDPIAVFQAFLTFKFRIRTSIGLMTPTIPMTGSRRFPLTPKPCFFDHYVFYRTVLTLSGKQLPSAPRSIGV